MTNYQSGRAFEYQVKRLLEQAGFEVTRAASSKGKFAGMPTDLIATRFTDDYKYELGILVLQCKKTKRTNHE